MTSYRKMMGNRGRVTRRPDEMSWWPGLQRCCEGRSVFISQIASHMFSGLMSGKIHTNFRYRPFNKFTITLCRREDWVHSFKWHCTCTSKCHFSYCFDILIFFLFYTLLDYICDHLNIVYLFSNILESPITIAFLCCKNNIWICDACSIISGTGSEQIFTKFFFKIQEEAIKKSLSFL